jgi:hypothetical protein
MKIIWKIEFLIVTMSCILILLFHSSESFRIWTNLKTGKRDKKCFCISIEIYAQTDKNITTKHYFATLFLKWYPYGTKKSLLNPYLYQILLFSNSYLIA